MTIELKAIITLSTILVLLAVAIIFRLLPKRLKKNYYQARWMELQAFCKDKNTWPLALKEADDLLGNALKRRKFKGKSMGERMVSAGDIFTENDSVWFAHNIVKKINARRSSKLRERDVKLALIGFRQALRDIGALPDDNKKDPSQL
ncbi:MAG TPA: hypothetical protein VLG25_02570 [Patescibacteria group bacterium]|nr:hypothetical protein [Patescibacteria group bacterium]